MEFFCVIRKGGWIVWTWPIQTRNYEILRLWNTLLSARPSNFSGKKWYAITPYVVLANQEPPLFHPTNHVLFRWHIHFRKQNINWQQYPFSTIGFIHTWFRDFFYIQWNRSCCNSSSIFSCFICIQQSTTFLPFLFFICAKTCCGEISTAQPPICANQRTRQFKNQVEDRIEDTN